MRIEHVKAEFEECLNMYFLPGVEMGVLDTRDGIWLQRVPIYGDHRIVKEEENVKAEFRFTEYLTALEGDKVTSVSEVEGHLAFKSVNRSNPILISGFDKMLAAIVKKAHELY